MSNPAISPGYSMHHELGLMVEAGMTPRVVEPHRTGPASAAASAVRLHFV